MSIGENKCFPCWYQREIILDAYVRAGVDIQDSDQTLTTAQFASEYFEMFKDRQEHVCFILNGSNPHEMELVLSSSNRKGVKMPIKVGNPTVQLDFAVGIHTRYLKNQKVVLGKVHDKFLSASFLSKTPRELECIIQELHKDFFVGTAPFIQKPVARGRYREGWVVVQPEGLGPSSDRVFPHIASQHPNQFAEFQRIYERVFPLGGIDKKAYLTLSEEEKRVLSLAFVIIYTDPTTIPNEMETFCNAYVDRLRLSNIDPVALAAWVHMEIVRIHPFEDGNGRLARMLANTELVRGKHSPFVISDSVRYKEAVQKSLNTGNPSPFETYLREAIELSKRLGAVLDQEPDREIKVLKRA